MADEEGGTKIARRPPPQVQQQQVQQQVQQPVYQQQQPVQQVQQQPVQQPVQPRIQRAQQEVVQEPSISTFGSKSKFINFNSVDFKHALLVIVIFILLNSKMIWTQLQKFPMMGTIEPSMLALIVNSVIAGMSFYVISNFIMKK